MLCGGDYKATDRSCAIVKKTYADAAAKRNVGKNHRERQKRRRRRKTGTAAASRIDQPGRAYRKRGHSRGEPFGKNHTGTYRPSRDTRKGE